MNGQRMILRSVVVAAVLWVAPAQAVTVTLRPAADTSLFESQPNNNFGRAWLVAGTIDRSKFATANKSRTLVRFDLTATNIPANAIITNASVAFRVVRSPAGGSTSTFAVHRMLVSWVEGNQGTQGINLGGGASTGEPTWAERAVRSVSWGAPGGQAGGDYSLQASGTRVLSLNTMTINSTSNLVADVQMWLTNSTANFGWMLLSQSEGTSKTARRFGSRESSGNEPTLTIQYTVPTTANPPVISSQPVSNVGYAGETLGFNVVASGDGTLTYQWLKDGVAITGATSSNLSLTNVQSVNAGTYKVEVSNAGGKTTSTEVTLNVLFLKADKISVAGGSTRVDFIGLPLRNYVLEGREDLLLGNWTALTNIQNTTTTAPMSLSVSVGMPIRFFRLAAQPLP